MRKILLIAIFHMFGSCAFEQDIQVIKLRNDIDLVFCKNDISPVVNIGIIFDVGYIDTEIGKREIVDLIANSIISDNRSKKMDSIGVLHDIVSSNEFTEIFATMHPDNVRFYLREICDALLNFSTESFDYRKKQIIIRKKLSNCNYDGAVYEATLANVRIPHKNTRLMFNENAFASITEKNVLDFYNDKYKKSHLLVIVVGNISLDQISGIANETVGSLEKRSAVRKYVCENEGGLEQNISSKFLGSSLGFLYKISAEHGDILDLACEVYSYEIWKTFVIRNPIVDSFSIDDLLMRSNCVKRVLLYPRIETSIADLRVAYQVLASRLKNREYVASLLSDVLKKQYFIEDV